MVEMNTGFILHVINVAGKRKKLAGIDSFSRRDLLEGMMNGQNPLDFITINKSDNKR